jgi:hypothetical protein
LERSYIQSVLVKLEGFAAYEKKESKNKMCSFSGSKFEDTEKLTIYIHTCIPKYVVLTFRHGLT